MANLPMNRTRLNAAVANQQPSLTAASQANREAHIEAADTIDLLNQKVDGLVAGSVLVPFPPDFMSRQAIINGNFDVPQRGKSFASPNNLAYTLDRYQTSFVVSGMAFPVLTHSQLALISGELPSSRYCYRVNSDGAGSAVNPGAIYAIRQKIENGTALLCGAGKKVTVSFWARSSIANKRIGVTLLQLYGSGGAPSGADSLNGGNFALTPNWTKYTVTFTTASLAGKIFGANNDDVLIVDFGLMWAGDLAARYGSAVSESFGGAGNTDIAQVQVNAGDAALLFQPRSFAEELALCRHYFRTLGDAQEPIASGVIFTPTSALFALAFEEMRVPPTITFSAASDLVVVNNSVVTTPTALSANFVQKKGAEISAAVSGLTQGQGAYLRGNNGTVNKIKLDAEL